MSRTWTIDEASADLPSLLDAARTSSQYIIVPDGKFEVSFEQGVVNSLDDVLNQEGHLKPGDIEGL
ncbi:conserved hypothetical protein [Agrobacterium genomosp. 13 str. CFBP 6927]|uniref:Uncharacterized protein n=2 Tax=Agrobacterium genomosp. 13 TaxID=1183419 RepID=A0ABM9VDK1_9HYPH|nr:conserved hypothetical protein [Agrobacterium genomosp. 13 str. CFBP 6927]